MPYKSAIKTTAQRSTKSPRIASSSSNSGVSGSCFDEPAELLEPLVVVAETAAAEFGPEGAGEGFPEGEAAEVLTGIPEMTAADVELAHETIASAPRKCEVDEHRFQCELA